MRGFTTALAAALITGLAAAQGPQMEPQMGPEETPEVLPAGEGREETFYACTACHSTVLIRRQGMSRERWDETLRWMSERQGMPALEGAERALVLDYLAAAFPPKRALPPSPFLDR